MTPKFDAIAKYFAEQWNTSPETVQDLALIFLRAKCLPVEPEVAMFAQNMIRTFLGNRGIEAEFEGWPEDVEGLNRKMKALARLPEFTTEKVA